MLELKPGTSVSMNSDGVLQFDAAAVSAFRCRRIEFVAVCDGRSGKTAIRPLVAEERQALGLGTASFAQFSSDGESPREYLGFVGIKIRAGKKYEAYLIGTAKGILVTVL